MQPTPFHLTLLFLAGGIYVAMSKCNIGSAWLTGTIFKGRSLGAVLFGLDPRHACTSAMPMKGTPASYRRNAERLENRNKYGKYAGGSSRWSSSSWGKRWSSSSWGGGWNAWHQGRHESRSSDWSRPDAVSWPEQYEEQQAQPQEAGGEQEHQYTLDELLADHEELTQSPMNMDGYNAPPSQEWIDEVFGQHFPPSREEEENPIEYGEHNRLTPQPPSVPPPSPPPCRPPATPMTSWIAAEPLTVSKATAMQPPAGIDIKQSQKALAILTKAVSDLAALHMDTDKNQSG